MSRPHIFGPYRHGARWRLITRDRAGRRRRHTYDSYPDALEARAEMLGEHGDDILALVSSPVELPHDPVWVYMLHDEAGQVIYVGSTRDPDDRRRDHRLNGVEFARMVVYPEVLDRDRGMSVESALIRKHQPRLNWVWKLGTNLGTHPPRENARSR